MANRDCRDGRCASVHGKIRKGHKDRHKHDKKRSKHKDDDRKHHHKDKKHRNGTHSSSCKYHHKGCDGSCRKLYDKFFSYGVCHQDIMRDVGVDPRIYSDKGDDEHQIKKAFKDLESLKRAVKLARQMDGR